MRARVLKALAPQLTGELLAQGLEAALALEDEWYRAEALAVLARVVGFWEELKRFPVFDILILIGTFILPWLTAVVVFPTPPLLLVTAITR